jgi:hypothetical protein
VPGGFRSTRRAAVAAAAVVAVLGLGWGPGYASATFHEISIREVYPGSSANLESEFVELQMWSPGQNFVAGHTLKTYNALGGATGTTTFTGDVPRGTNQSTILLATAAAEAEFGVAADAAMTPGQLAPGGGAACWEALDCVSWGSFSGSLPSPAGSPASPAGIPDGMALRRTISPGCATLLEPSDDRDNSAADFSAVFPDPRPNSVAPGEHPCPSVGGQQGGGGNQDGQGAPQTTLKHKPPHRTRDRTPTFRFGADEAGSTFQCKLDSKPFRPCRSPYTAAKLSLGPHTFKVRARDDSGRLDPSPAVWSFREIAKRR